MDIVVVSLCSTKNLMLEGGPLPWIVDTSGYYEEGERDGLCFKDPVLTVMLFVHLLLFWFT